LTLSIQSGQTEVVQVFLRQGWDVSQECHFLNTAIVRGYLDIVQLLMQYGANPDLQNRWGKTSWDVIRKPEQNDFEEVMKNTKPIEKRKEGTFRKLIPAPTTLSELLDRLPPPPVKKPQPTFKVMKL
jgi:hypothetical protein